MSYIKYKIPFLFGELFFIKFPPKCKTTIHYHGGKECYYFPLSTRIFEKIFSNNKCIKIHHLAPYKYYHINDNIGSHKIINNNNKNAYSINYYI